MESSVPTAPALDCTRYVTTDEPMESASRGAFSQKTPAFGFAPSRMRPSGQISSRTSAKGSVTTTGLDISPRQNGTAARRYRPGDGRLA